MHVYFSGIGGSGISSMALLALQAGYEVSGSDASDSDNIDYLRRHGIEDIHIGQDEVKIAAVHRTKPIDWFVYSSAIPKTDANHPELLFCEQNNIKTTKRDEFLNQIIKDKDLKLIAVGGTHGKSTTTAMAIWVFNQLGQPVSYSSGAKLGFGEPGAYAAGSQYFIYEADEYDRNFLSFYPALSLISGLDYDHPDTYTTPEAYIEAFEEFIEQSSKTILWHDDAEKLSLQATPEVIVLDQNDPAIDNSIKLVGHVNRLDAWLVAQALAKELSCSVEDLIEILNRFPGLARRFEQIAPNIYSDYAHTPAKIRGALQLANEQATGNVVVVYEGLHNTRQHFIKDQLTNLFDGVKKLYVVPSYLAREDKSLKLLEPQDLIDLLSVDSKTHAESASLNASLKEKILTHQKDGDLILCLSAGGAGSLDEWLRKNLKN